MTDTIQRTILECGFLPPNSDFVKQDPRGKEYGYFSVVISATAARIDPSIRVVKRGQSGLFEWAANFDNQISFRNWAQDNT